MKDRWIDISADAETKQARRFDSWQLGDDISFTSPEAKRNYRKRVGLIRDAIQMQKAPERIPICPSVGHFPIEYAGISWKEAMYDYPKLAGAWERFFADFTIDAISGPRSITPGKVLDDLGFTLYHWAGSGLRDNQEYQFVEKEYMSPDEYWDLIDDPTGFFLSVFFPRVFHELDALKKMPLLPPIHEIIVVPNLVLPFSADDLTAAFTKLHQAGLETRRWLDTINTVTAGIMGKGFPSFSGGFSKAPFDLIGDALRGTRGIMIDMFRHPDLLIEACERLTPFMIKCGIAACNASGHLMPFIPLHKGADTFMSEKQFEKFYWPTLRKVIIGLTNEGLVPVLFAEGSYNKRLDIICDLPKGKTIWWFDNVDMARAKKTVGKVACIAGNVPLDLLCTSSPEKVRDYCKALIDTMGTEGFIFSTGAGMQRAKTENVRAMIEFAHEYGT